MYPVSPQAYDRAITVFSPDGRLFQVEYAKEAVKRGATAIGITYKDGVALVSHKIIQSPLVVPESMKKIFEIDTHIYTTASGLIADARRLIDYARSIASSHRMTYDEPPSVIKIAREVSDTLQVYTQYGGIRPFGVSLLIAGVDKEPELYEVEPSGALTGYTAAAIGRGKKVAEELLEKKYKKGMDRDEAILLAVKALKKSEESALTHESVEIAYTGENGKDFVMLTGKEVERFIKKV
ncbi:archaeal proteasome endopeptidase complex subunit alpha [Candidatus Micrarchaeota archaeon]|nr:archaeal proteasome endopeptidase complex subunit alpha [Candidatus Micrarchaeota archaeon]